MIYNAFGGGGWRGTCLSMTRRIRAEARERLEDILRGSAPGGTGGVGGSPVNAEVDLLQKGRTHLNGLRPKNNPSTNHADDSR